MALYNLFDFATKELSQDAFLMWLLSNINDEEIGKATKKLLNKINTLYPDKPIDIDRITRIKTDAQQKYMDIVANLYVDETIQYTIVIEDKVGSGIHDDQLNEYNKKIKAKNVYKIFYKPQLVSKEEKEEVESANWKLIQIDDIFEIFEGFKESKNNILADYSNHIITKYNEFTIVSNKPLIEWNFDEWETFFRLELIPLANSKFANNIRIKTWKYRGRYISAGIYHKNMKSKTKPLIEMFFRDKDVITATIHPQTEGAIDSWARSEIASEFTEKFNFKMANKEMPSFNRLNSKHCIAKMTNPIVKTTKEEVTSKILNIITEFYLFFLDF